MLIHLCIYIYIYTYICIYIYIYIYISGGARRGEPAVPPRGRIHDSNNLSYHSIVYYYNTYYIVYTRIFVAGYPLCTLSGNKKRDPSGRGQNTGMITRADHDTINSINMHSTHIRTTTNSSNNTTII